MKQKPFSRYLWAILGFLALFCHAFCGSAELVAENELERFISNEIELFAKPKESACAADKISNYMDNLAVKLLDAISNKSMGEIILKELQEAINLNDLLELSNELKKVELESKPQAPVKKSKYGPGNKSAGLMDVLSNENENTEFVVHSNTKLSEEAKRDLMEFASSGVVSTERYMQFFSDPRWNKFSDKSRIDMAKSNKIQAMKTMLIEGFNKGAMLMDQLYLSTDFLDRLPIIGNEIVKLKKSGQQIYDLIKTIRSFKTFLEVYSTNQTIRSLLVRKGTRMLNNVGAEALKLLAVKMVKQKLGIEVNAGAVNEISSRCAYYLLANFMPSCKLTSSS